MLKLCDLSGGKKEEEEEEDHVSYRQWKRGVLRSAIYDMEIEYSNINQRRNR